MKKLFLLTLLASSAFAENSFNLSDGSMYWLGRGYDTFKQKGAASCLTLNPNSTETVSSSGKINLDFVSDISKIDNYLGIGAQGRARSGAVEYSASADYSKETKQNSYSLSYNYLGEFYQKVAIKEADNAPQFQALLSGTNDGIPWKETCGDEFVYAAEKGARIFLNMKITFVSKFQKEKFEAAIGVKGPAFSASGKFQKIASDFNENTRLTVSALQVGGDPSKLGRIFCPATATSANCQDSSKQLTSCAFGELAPCMAVLANFINYANSSEEGNFGAQINNFTNYSTLKVSTQPYYFLGTKFPRISPQANALFEQELSTLFDFFDEQFNNWTFASDVYQGNAPRKSPNQKNNLEILGVTFENNARELAKTIDGCYEHGLQYCIDRKKLTLSKMDVSDNGIKGKDYPARKLIEDEVKPVVIAQFCDLRNEVAKISTTTNFLVSLVAEKKDGVPMVDEYKKDDWCKRLDDDLNSLTNLEINNLENFSTKMIGSLINLKKLKIHNTKEFDFSTLANLVNLEEIILSETSVSQLEFLKTMSSLKSLTLINNGSLKKTSGLNNLPSLNELIAYGNYNDVICPSDSVKCLMNDFSKDISTYSFQKQTNCYFGTNTSSVMVDTSSGSIISTSSSDYLVPGIRLNKLSLDSGNCETLSSTMFPAVELIFPGRGIKNEVPYKILEVDSELNRLLILLPSGIAIINSQGSILEYQKLPAICEKQTLKERIPLGMNFLKLSNGSVLLSGGTCESAFSDALIKIDFNFSVPMAQNIEKISAFRMKVPRSNHTMTETADAQVIVMGGMSNQKSVKEVEVLDISKMIEGKKDVSRIVGALQAGRFDHSATLLNNGSVLVVGGFPKSDMTEALNSAELFDPKSFKSKIIEGSLNESRGQHQAIKLEDGRVLIIAGASQYLKNTLTALIPHFDLRTPNDYYSVITENKNAKDSLEIFDPELQKFFMVGKLNVARTNFSVVKITENQYGVIGGSGLVPNVKMGQVSREAPSSSFEIIQINL